MGGMVKAELRKALKKILEEVSLTERGLLPGPRRAVREIGGNQNSQYKGGRVLALLHQALKEGFYELAGGG